MGLSLETKESSIQRKGRGECILLKFIYGGHVVSFNKRAIVACRARQFRATVRDIIVTRTVSSRCKLFEKLQSRKCAGVNGYS